MKKTKKTSGGAAGQPAPAKRQERHALLDALDNLEDAKERLEACAALASKFEPMEDDDIELEAKMKKEIVSLGRDGMFKSLVRCANDIDPVVRATAIGALRNLALTGQDKSLSLMQQEDAWSAMCVVLMREDGSSDEIEIAAQREALHVMELMCEWSTAIAERRLSESLNVVAPKLNVSRDAGIVEACAKLMFTASDNNTQLAKTVLSIDSGRALGQSLEHLLTKLSPPISGSNDNIVSAAYSLGTLVNLSSAGELAELHLLCGKWFEMCQNILSESALPIARLTDEIVSDARAFEEDEIEEDGSARKESDRMRHYLDLVQTQALLFDIWGDLLRKIAEDNEGSHLKKREYWATSILPLEERGLLACSLTFALSSLPEECPKSLSLAVFSLQESASQCACAAFEVFTHIDALMCRETFRRVLAALISTVPSNRDLAIAYAELVASSARRAGQSVFGSELEASQVLRLMQESALEPIRALMCAPIVKLCESNPNQFLPIIAPVLLDQLAKEKSVIVAAEIADALMDLFSEDGRQELLDRLDGLSAFTNMVKSFVRRLEATKRDTSGEEMSEEALERAMEVKANLIAFIEWRQSQLA